MKLNQLLILGLLVLTFQNSKLNAKIIHTDPYDIRRASFNAGFLFTGPRGFGVFANGSYYLKPNLNLHYSVNFFPLLFMGEQFHDYEDSKALIHADGKTMFMYNSVGLDIHFYDKKRPKTTPVVLHTSTETRGTKTINTNYIEQVPTFKRHVWAVYAGLMTITGREMFYRYKSGSNDQYEVMNLSSNQNVDIASMSTPDFSMSVSSYSSIYNLEVGIKNKGIFATAVEHEKYGRKWQDAYAEWYLTALLPVASSFESTVSRKNNPNRTYKIINDIKPKPGFKLGFNFRTSVKSNVYMGGDFGFLPSMTQKSGNVLHFSIRFGYNLNLGKVNYEEVSE